MRFKDYCYQNIIEKKIFKELDDSSIYYSYYLYKHIISKLKKNIFIKKRKYNIYNCTKIFINKEYISEGIIFKLNFYNFRKIKIYFYNNKFDNIYFNNIIIHFINILLLNIKKIKEYKN